MKDYSELNPRLYDKRHESIQREGYLYHHWRPLIEYAIDRYCKDKSSGLDLGCGTGNNFMPLLKKNLGVVLGLDFTITFLKHGKKLDKELYLLCGDAHNIPLKDKSIDVAISNLFEYVDKEIVLDELHRVLNNDGILILLTLNENSAWWIINKFIMKIKNISPDKKRSLRKDWKYIFEDNGFEVLEFKMDDGLIWLPDALDQLCGKKIYLLIEHIFRLFPWNPLSNEMLFIAKRG